MNARFTIAGVGEALFDVLPDRQVLGGATLNVAVHAHQLAKPLHGRGVVASRVGQDALGRQVMATLRERGMDVSHIQQDPDRPTGVVYVDLSDPAKPDFEIVENVAWDWMQFDYDWQDLAERCEAVCFGSLAQRVGESRSAILRFLATARRAIRLFDVNLRQSYYDLGILKRSCENATVVKLNDEELPIVARTIGLSKVNDDASADQAIEEMIDRFGLNAVALTRGAKGTVLYSGGNRYEGDVPQYESADQADGVGAGDACSAGLLVGMVRHWPAERTLALANHMGAYVASQPGATPELPDAILGMVKG